MLWIIRDTNIDAIKYYLDILEKSAIIVGQKVKQVENAHFAKNGDKNDTYLVTTITDAVKIYLMGKRRVFVWFQGVFSEESYMKHKSIFRKYILGRIEKLILEKAQFVFFVSDEMKKYYTKRFKVNIDNKYYVMPCFNANINKDSFIAKDKYKNNLFCYVGSLSVWQRFDKILECYKTIEQIGIPGTKLLILTREKEKAQELIRHANIKNYCIDYVPLEKLPNVLAQAKFGFILRDNVIVNRVATPTKISTYMANGLIPIYSECIVDFHGKAKGMKHVVSFDRKDFIKKIESIMRGEIDTNEISNEYSRFFNNYFNANYHANLIADKTKKIYYQ